MGRALPLVVHPSRAQAYAHMPDHELEEELTLAALTRQPAREQRFEALLVEKRRRRFLRRALG